jgi:hypothetical protein
LESFETWGWMRMKKKKWSEKVTNEQILERIGKKKTLLNNITGNWVGHSLRINCLLHGVFKGLMPKLKGVKKEEQSSLMI